jgi:hypothetical protein
MWWRSPVVTGILLFHSHEHQRNLLTLSTRNFPVGLMQMPLRHLVVYPKMPYKDDMTIVFHPLVLLKTPRIKFRNISTLVIAILEWAQKIKKLKFSKNKIEECNSSRTNSKRWKLRQCWKKPTNSHSLTYQLYKIRKKFLTVYLHPSNLHPVSEEKWTRYGTNGLHFWQKPLWDKEPKRGAMTRI